MIHVPVQLSRKLLLLPTLRVSCQLSTVALPSRLRLSAITTRCFATDKARGTEAQYTVTSPKPLRGRTLKLGGTKGRKSVVHKLTKDGVAAVRSTSATLDSRVVEKTFIAPQTRFPVYPKTDEGLSTSRSTALAIKQVAVRELRRRIRAFSFEQWHYESRTEIEDSDNGRLVDDVISQHDPELWLALLYFRKRIDGVQGIMNIWTGFRRRSIRPESSYSWLWQKLWMNFFRAGMKDEVVLSEMCEHFRLTYGEHDKSPNGIYFDVVGLFLKQKPQWAFRWHKRLERYPPTLSERFKLFDISMASSMSRRAFFRIYAVLPPVRGAYSVMLPRLCARGLYADAIIWHRLLIGSGDIPSDTSIIKPLLEKLAATGKDELLAEIMFDMVNAGVPMDIAGESSQQEGPVISWQMMNEAHSNLFKIKPRRFSDDFCARLLATKMFSIKTIISGLQILGVDAIGPLALQAIATRSIHDGVCSPTEVLGYIQQLQEAEISIGISKFSRLVRKIAQEGNSGLLYDIVTSDQHPEVLEDQQKQESLLASYDRLGDHRQINRTLAILTLDDEKDFVNAKHWNILLRQDLRLHDPRGLSRTVEAMIESKIPLTATSRSFMREKMMEVRLPGRRPMNEMPGQIIGIWQRAMQSGTFIPVGDWVELLRRLSMAGRFRQYENLAIWLSKWYTDETFRKSQTPLTTDGARSALQYNLPPNQANPKHPFRVLFSTSMQHAVLAWGFAKRFDERGLMNLKQMTFYGRARSLAQSECLRGLRMIASLRDIGVHIDRQQISKMCRVRLRTMFGIHLSRRQRFKSVEWYRQGRWPEYALAMRMIWGPDLFAPTSTSTDLVPKRHSAPQVLADLAQRLKSDAHRRADKLKAERDKVRDKVEKDRNDHQIGSLFLST